jgi:hypothetical protein
MQHMDYNAYLYPTLPNKMLKWIWKGIHHVQTFNKQKFILKIKFFYWMDQYGHLACNW